MNLCYVIIQSMLARMFKRLKTCLFTPQVYSFCPETCVWKGQGSFECAGFNAGAVGMKDRIYILGGDYSPDEITDEVQVGKSFPYIETVLTCTLWLD